MTKWEPSKKVIIVSNHVDQKSFIAALYMLADEEGRNNLLRFLLKVNPKLLSAIPVTVLNCTEEPKLALPAENKVHGVSRPQLAL